MHVVTHESFEAPAAIEGWARNRGWEVTHTRLFCHEAFPNELDFDLLVVMGGPQSPATTPAECPHFDGPREIAFIKQVIERDKLVLGVCLGAQLIGEALGAPFAHSPEREIGVFPLHLTDHGKSDRLFGKFPAEFLVAHWHGDMPGLTAQASILASSVGCPRQIIRYTPKVYGFQCHFEFTADSVEGMIQNSGEELELFKKLPYVQSADQLRKHSYEMMNQLLFQFLDAFTDNL